MDDLKVRDIVSYIYDGTNPCTEVNLSGILNKNMLEASIHKHFGGVPYEDITKLLKQYYPENFI